MRVQVAVRLPDDLIERLDSLVPATHPSRSDAVRRAIELYLYALACEQDAGEAKCGGQMCPRQRDQNPRNEPVRNSTVSEQRLTRGEERAHLVA